MKCPHCNKEIKEPEPTKFERFMKVIPLNMMVYTLVAAVMLTQFNHYVTIPWNIENGAKMNYDMLLMFIPVIFVLVYVGLYVNQKVKGRLLLFK